MFGIILWLKAHKGVFYTLCFGTALGIATGVLFVKQLKKVEDQGWFMLFLAQQYAFQGPQDQAHSILTNLENKYQNSAIGDFAFLFHGNFFTQEKNWQQAMERYQTVISRKKAKNLLPLASLGLAKCHEALGQFDQAKAQYQSFINSYTDHYAAPEAYAGLARMAELTGSAQESKETFEKLRVLYPDTLWAHQAELKLKLLAASIKKPN